MKKNTGSYFVIKILLFIFIFGFITFFHSQPANASAFRFIDETKKIVTQNISLTKNSNGAISKAIIGCGGNFYFYNKLSFDAPQKSSYLFSSSAYDIDNIKTGTSNMAILNGESDPPAYSVVVIYLKSKNQAASAVVTQNNNYVNFNYAVNANSAAQSAPKINNNFGYSERSRMAENNYTVKSTTTSGTLNGFNYGAFSSSATSTNSSANKTQNIVTTPAVTYVTGGNFNGAKSLFGQSQTYSNTLTTPANSTVSSGTSAQTTTQAVTAGNSTTTPAKTSIPKTIFRQDIGTSGGTVTGYIRNQNGLLIAPEQIVVTVTNRNGTFSKSTILNTDGTKSVYQFQIDGIPQILQGSADSYTVSVISENLYSVSMGTPSSFKVYGSGQTVNLSGITMAANRGSVNLTLYHGTNALFEDDASLLVLAQNTVINLPGMLISARFTGESPRHFYRFAIDDAPAGTWTYQIMFPGHKTIETSKIWVPSNASTNAFFNLTEYK